MISGQSRPLSNFGCVATYLHTCMCAYLQVFLTESYGMINRIDILNELLHPLLN